MKESWTDFGLYGGGVRQMKPVPDGKIPATMPNLERRPAFGAAFLDLNDPEWRTRIAPKLKESKLDISQPYGCVLALLYGSYFSGLERHSLTSNYAAKMGFAGFNEEFPVLTAEWVKILGVE